MRFVFFVLGLWLVSFMLNGQANYQSAEIKKPRRLNIPYDRKKPLITYEGNMVVVTPAHSTVPIVNPGKGWAGYGSVASQPPDVLKIQVGEYRAGGRSIPLGYHR